MTINEPEVTPRYLSEKNAMKYTSFSRYKIRAWGKEIGAMRKIGGRIVFDRKIIDEAMAEGEEE